MSNIDCKESYTEQSEYDKNYSRKFQKVKDFSYCFNKKGVSVMPPELQKINSEFLQILELKNNRFKIIPKQIFEFINLKTLRMDNNFIR